MFIIKRNSIIAMNAIVVMLLAILLLDIFKINNLWVFVPMCAFCSVLFIYVLIKIRFTLFLEGLENTGLRTLIRYGCMMVFIATLYGGLKLDYLVLYAIDALVAILFAFNIQALVRTIGR